MALDRALCRRARTTRTRPSELTSWLVTALWALSMSACESSGERAMGSSTAAQEIEADESGGPCGDPRAGRADPESSAPDAARTELANGDAAAADAGAKADAGAHHGSHFDCTEGPPADPRDMLLSGAPDEWLASNGAVDLVLPKHVLDWMDERVWKQSHDAWHNVRRCGGVFALFGNEICARTELISAHQECADAQDGYAFLVMHRHMIASLKQAFPEHTELFEGFPSFPHAAEDVPEAWRDRWGTGWSRAILDTANTLEDIENRLSQFPTEGDLGRYIQCGGMSGASSIHGALHFKWVVNESPNSLGKQSVNIGNYMFWKLHGWIDKIWERYRVAKGLTPEEPALAQELVKQCTEMHTLAGYVDPSGNAGPDRVLPEERGFFHESVRPILERYCSSCHSESSPEAGLSLGGQIASAQIVQGLVNMQSVRGGQFVRVAPGVPEQSWLYLKVSGAAMEAGCEGTCNAQVMPPTGQVTLDERELATIRQWISDGADAPTE